jgi:hypothetical protein
MADTSEAGTSEAGTSEAGTSEAGTSEAGTSEAGTSEAGTEEKYKCVIYILNACNITCNSFKELDGLVIPRTLCLNDEKYLQIKTEFTKLKKHFSSSYLTALQSTATSKQKFPLLNLIRQLLRSCNYKLTPKRITDGYTLSGEKKYIRMFIIEKMKI